MKHLIASALLSVAHVASAGTFLNESFTFQPDGQSANANRFDSNDPMKVERGEYRGNSYSIWVDGLAQVSHWRIRCSKDQMTDERSCLINADDFWVLVNANGVRSVVIGDKHSPGKTVAVRIDEQKAINSNAQGWAGKDAARVVKDATTGSVIATRYWRWPEDRWTDRKTTAAGLSQALDVAIWMCKQGR